MKLLIYKHPIISSILINIITLCIATYLFKSRYITFIIVFSPFSGILNRKIIENGVGINKKKKVFIICSFILIEIIFLFGIYNNAR